MAKHSRVITWSRWLALASFVGLGVLVYGRYSHLMVQVGSLTGAQNIAGATLNISSMMKDAETGYRGYVITGNDSYLVAYTEARANVPPDIARLQTATANAPDETPRVAEFLGLVDETFQTIDRGIALRRDQGFEAARAAIAASGSTSAADRLRASGAALAAFARQRVADERAANFRSTTVTRWLMLFLFVFAIAMVLLAGFQVRRELARRGRAEDALRRAYAEVEERVTLRTQELVGAHDQLESSERRLRLVADFGIVHLFTMNATGATEYVTAGFSALTGLETDRALGFGWIEAAHPDDRDRLMTAWRDALARADSFETLFRLGTADGQYRWFKMRAMPVAAANGQVEQWVGAAIDMHNQQEIAVMRADLLKREQAARADAELANRLKDDFLASVSHELRTPLNAIVGWVHLLKTDAAEDRGRAVEAIERNAFAQARLIDDLLDVSQMIKGRFTLAGASVDLRQPAQAALETIRPAAAAKHIEISFIEEGDVIVFGDAARLQQVTWNLLSNAVKYTGRGGHVTVEVVRVGSRARLRVTDDGEGIDAGFLPHVFEPFRQGVARSAPGGLGLGLAIVRQLVELHGGTVVVDSPGSGRGSSFTVMLPLIEATTRVATSAGTMLASRSEGLRVLVAEDDEDAAVTLGAMLVHRGCHVRTARTAQECMAIFDQWKPDLLLCDIGLPDNDGYSLLRQLRDRDERPRPVPAIALTAFAREQDRSRSLTAGFSAHVSKPFDPDQLVEEIMRAVSRPV